MAKLTQFVRIGNRVVNLDQITSVELKTSKIAAINLCDGKTLHFSGDEAAAAHAAFQTIWDPLTKSAEGASG